MKIYLVVFLLNFFGLPVYGQDRIMDDPISAYMYPGKTHSLLANYVGEWNAEMKSSMGNGAITSSINLEGKGAMILDGRFLHLTLSGTISGAPFSEEITIGYDNLRGVFQMMSFTNLSTIMIHTEGGWDQEAKLATLRGTVTHPYLTSPIRVRKLLNMAGADTLILTDFDTIEGKKEQKTGEIILVRKK